MPLRSVNDIKDKLPKILEQVPYLKLLVLFGSRARGDSASDSDWDFAVLYDEELRQHYENEELGWLRIWSVLQIELQLTDDQIDIVMLNQCSDILAHTIAQDGKLLYENQPGEFERFRATALMSQEEQKKFIAMKRAEVRAALARWKV